MSAKITQILKHYAKTIRELLRADPNSAETALAPKFQQLIDSLLPELRDVAARIHELIHWFGAADLVLEATLADTLTREELGFPAAQAQGAESGDE